MCVRESQSILKMFRASEDALKRAAQLFDTTEETLKKDVETITAWLKTQPHLPEIMDPISIQNFLVLNKGSVERAKTKIDNYYTVRGVIPDFYEDTNISSATMKKFLETTYCLTFKQPVDGLYRVFFCKNKTDSFLPYEMIKFFLSMAEVRLHEDCMVGEVLVFDMQNMSLQDIMKMTPIFVAKSFAVYEKVYSMRIKAMYFVNSPPIISRLISILKSVMKPKIFSRIQVFEDAKILTEVFSKDNLPKDYGGDGPSLDELQEMVVAKLSEYQDRFDRLDKMKVDGSLRPAKLKNDELLGFHGNFKKLDMD